MTDSEASSPPLGDDNEITLGLLNAVHDNEALTQRSAARELGIALGLANAYLKRCVKKGYIKVRQIPRNRYAYYLTPKGFAEKSRLTAYFLSQSFQFFREARTDCRELLAICAEHGWTRVVLIGTGDLGEIATFCAQEYPVTLLGFVDPERESDHFAGLPVADDITAFEHPDAVLITDIRNPQATFEAIVGVMPRTRVLAPALLKVARQRRVLAEE